jgi:hypothetical protein
MGSPEGPVLKGLKYLINELTGEGWCTANMISAAVASWLKFQLQISLIMIVLSIS